MFYCGISDIGKKRSSNQDSFNITELDGALLCTVCDGMGGANGGNVASELAVKTYTAYIRDVFSGRNDGGEGRGHINVRTLLSGAVAAANTAVYQRAESDFTLSGMGTTLVSALILGDMLYAVNVGDSRMYVIVSGEIRQITRDHSYVQYLLDLGKITPEEAKNSPMKNIITRSVGNEESIKPDIFTMNLRPDSCYFLLCSDGLTNFVPEAQILNIVTGFSDGTTDQPFSDKRSGDEALLERAKRLVRLANDAGGGDNITALLVRY